MTATVHLLHGYHRVQPSPTHPGRWLVGHTVPGTGVFSADEDCPSHAAALQRCAQLDRQRITPNTAAA